MKILLVEDNELLSNNIVTYLKLKNIYTKQLFTWKGVNFEVVSDSYDLVILDIWLPEINGIKVCREIRNSWKNIPILILTARNKISDKIEWFNAWADDYLIKPFEYEELLMRINVLIRRNYSVKSELIKIWEIKINLQSKEIKKEWNIIHLSNLELNLLIYMIQNKWRVISKKQLFQKVWWEYDDFKMSRNVDVYIGYLRKKLGKEIITTIRWEWYTIN